MSVCRTYALVQHYKPTLQWTPTHREVNHTFASMEEDDYNPYVANAKYHAQVTEVKGKGSK